MTYSETTIGEQIKHQRKCLGITVDEIANKLNVNRATIYRWENNTNKVPATYIEPLAQVLGMKPSDLMGWAPENVQRWLFQRANLRFPGDDEISADESIEQYEDNVEYFFTKIKDKNMEPRIQEGDIVISHKQSKVESGDVAVILVNRHEPIVRVVKMHESGLSLISFNAAYEPKFFTNEEVVSLPIKIIGKVVELRGKI